jgi:hypothetical protein
VDVDVAEGDESPCSKVARGRGIEGRWARMSIGLRCVREDRGRGRRSERSDS